MNRLFYIGASIAAIFILMAIFAPWIATHDVTVQDLANRFASPSSEYWFGTDSLGRDVFSRVVYGARISLQVGITVVLVSGVIGIFIGAIAGFYGGTGLLIAVSVALDVVQKIDSHIVMRNYSGLLENDN